jgi:HPt (histidine-containing phosphotransfer) domain-containing protein
MKIYNLKKIEEISRGDTDFMRDIVITFVENVTREIEKIAALQVSEMWAGIAEISHKLASDYAYMGANALHCLASDIEKNVLYLKDLEGIREKTERLCADSVTLINKLKEDFKITK